MGLPVGGITLSKCNTTLLTFDRRRLAVAPEREHEKRGEAVIGAGLWSPPDRARDGIPPEPILTVAADAIGADRAAELCFPSGNMASMT